ncbi:hypothetical protein J2853_002534 [Streptosporangium lutulentum]|uniref:Uncharacterized protein n=2 Tax=Streptosporangium lutulentum TaxID=1461250 RepID=A0ABT9Q9A2_9ACTN|nr:hypothetical protein [Streptosporangium lutulentum]MDP9843323.1 hypothetical protein [Streptosporangium lutulentum]
MRWLEQHKAPGQGGGEKVSGSREAGTPTRLDVLAMLHDGAAPIHGDDDDQIGPPSIPSTLKNWAWLISEHRGLVYPERSDVAELAHWLLLHVDWATSRPWIDDMLGEIGALRRWAHSLAPWAVHVQELVGPCPYCDMRTLIRVSGERYIECDGREEVGGCGGLWTYEAYEDHVAALVKADKRRKTRKVEAKTKRGMAS